MADDQFLSFEDALDQLRLQEEELKRLVSEGEIRAFREGDTMKLRAQDVETLREELTALTPTRIVPEDEEAAQQADASEEIVFEDDVEVADEAGMATEEITDVETILQEEEEDDIEEIELEEEAPLTDTAVRRKARGPAAAVVEEVPQEGGLVKAALIVTSLVMILGVPVVMAVSADRISSLARAIASPFTGETMPQVNDR